MGLVKRAESLTAVGSKKGLQVARKWPYVSLVASSVLLLLAMVELLGCGSQLAVEPSARQSTTLGVSQDSTTTTIPKRTITSSTELIPKPEGSYPVMWLITGDFPAAGIQILEARHGPGPAPSEFYLNARLTEEQDAGEYEAIAEKILALSEKYKQQIYFDRLRVVLTVKGGAVVYDHTFQVSPPSGTTSTTQLFHTYYSAPRLDVSPRPGVSLTVTVDKSSQGSVTANVEIRNSSGSPFRFSDEDIQLYVDGTRIAQTDPRANPIDVKAGNTIGVGLGVSFNPSHFDPHSAGLLYISSDPQSLGFTASDGLTP